MSWNKLAIMAGCSFAVMYILMYAMVDVPGNVYVNGNQFLMAGMMTAAMVIIGVVVMGSMYAPSVRVRAGIISVLALILFFIGIRMQIGISDREFLRSMIPHHGAVLQQSEINWMRQKLSDIQ
jgi:uncharacterized protein (DUF305 family)